MSTARHHAEWLSLVEASGPFLSLPVLLKTFPAGLDAHDSEHLKLLRSASEEWQDNQFGLKPDPAIHRAWVEFVLKQTLELPDEVLLSGQQIPSGLSVTFAEQNETIRPDWVVEIELAELERYRAEGEEKLLAFLKEQMGKSPAALKKLLNTEIEPREAQRLRTACNNDAELFDRVLPFAPLIRKDTLDYPIVILADSVYVTEGVDRRQSGTHYTPRNLTEEIVQYTLEPLVYDGVAEGRLKEDWKLRSPSELLQLKICDMAMGSGAFLVQTCRYLAGKLVEAWQQAETEHPGQIVIAPEGTLSISRPEVMSDSEGARGSAAGGATDCGGSLSLRSG
jgi:hypothetical protein